MFKDFTLTPRKGNHSISPESSDGFASVGTILPNEKATIAGWPFLVLKGITASQCVALIFEDWTVIPQGRKPLRLAPATIQSNERQGRRSSVGRAADS